MKNKLKSSYRQKQLDKTQLNTNVELLIISIQCFQKISKGTHIQQKLEGTKTASLRNTKKHLS